MSRFDKADLSAALGRYAAVVDRCSETGDWAPYADSFTEDVVYEEHYYGEFYGREEVRQWIVDVMSPFPHMRLAHEWTAYDEEQGAVVVGIQNILDHPTKPGATFEFLNVTRLTYAGEGLFSRQEDVYNPTRDIPRVLTAWQRAGGRFAARPLLRPKYGD